MRASLLIAFAFAFCACSGESGPGAGSGGSGGSSGTGGCLESDGGYGYYESWVADRIVPGDPTANAPDLNGDEHPDDRLGSILQALQQQGFDPQPALDAMVQDATIVQLVDTQFVNRTCHSESSEVVSFFTGTPVSPACTTPGDPTTCGQHLHGDAHFTIPQSADATTLTGTGGTVTFTSFSIGPGTVVLHVSLLGSAPVALPLVRAGATFGWGGLETMEGAVAGAISQDTLHNLVFPAVAAGAEQAIAQDCPGGVCQAGSTGEKLLSLFDADHDGAITAGEIENNQLLSALFAPDVDTDGDGKADALSALFGLHLVKRAMN